MTTIQVLGTGCSKCQKPAENANEAAKALAVDGRVVVTARVPSVEELKPILGDAGR